MPYAPKNELRDLTITRVFLNGRPAYSIAKGMDLSQTRVPQIVRQIVAVLRRYAASQGELIHNDLNVERAEEPFLHREYWIVVMNHYEASKGISTLNATIPEAAPEPVNPKGAEREQNLKESHRRRIGWTRRRLQNDESVVSIAKSENLNNSTVAYGISVIKDLVAARIRKENGRACHVMNPAERHRQTMAMLDTMEKEAIEAQQTPVPA